MNAHRVALSIVGISLGAAFVLGEGVPETTLDLPWHTIDTGGTVLSTDGGYTLSGTIGQPDCGPGTAGRFTLNAGFWFPTALTDCAGDGDVDSFDSSRIIDCLLGPLQSPENTCWCFDVNRDRAVDIRDWAVLQVNFTGQ